MLFILFKYNLLQNWQSLKVSRIGMNLKIDVIGIGIEDKHIILWATLKNKRNFDLVCKSK